jgi:hypothetical protein
MGRLTSHGTWLLSRLYVPWDVLHPIVTSICPMGRLTSHGTNKFMQVMSHGIGDIPWDESSCLHIVPWDVILSHGTYSLTLVLSQGTSPLAQELSHGTIPMAQELSHGTIPMAQELCHGTIPMAQELSHGTIPCPMGQYPWPTYCHNLGIPAVGILVWTSRLPCNCTHRPRYVAGIYSLQQYSADNLLCYLHAGTSSNGDDIGMRPSLPAVDPPHPSVRLPRNCTSRLHNNNRPSTNLGRLHWRPC